MTINEIIFAVFFAGSLFGIAVCFFSEWAAKKIKEIRITININTDKNCLPSVPSVSSVVKNQENTP